MNLGQTCARCNGDVDTNEFVWAELWALTGKANGKFSLKREPQDLILVL